MTLKSRFIDVDKSLCATQWFTVTGGPKTNITLTYADLHGIEVVSDTSPHLFGSGGNLIMRRSTIKSSPAPVFAFTSTGGVDYFYLGKIYAKQYAGNNPVLPQPQLASTMLGYGVKGWNRYKPTSRNGSLAQAIVELRDVPRMLEQSQLAGILQRSTKNIAKEAGNQFLNASFGWTPFLNDIRALIRNAQMAERRIDQLARDNGKFVRRRGTVNQVASTTSSVSVGQFSSPTMVSPLYLGSETQYRTQSTSFRAWFSARFKYYIKPVGVGRLDRFLQAEHVNRILYGTDLSPSLVYELIPWSWLVDWFSSAGASIANYYEDSADNLVADYAYVMGYTMASDLYVVKGKTINGFPYETRQEYLTEVKQRNAASPYGFFAIPPTLSAKQIGILGALGLTRRANGR
jgi:hypothetical protein